MFQSVIWTLTRYRILNSDSAGIYTTRFCQLIEQFDQMTYRRFFSSIVLSLPFSFLVINLEIVGNSTSSKCWKRSRSIMVRAMKFIDEPVCIGRQGRHKEPPWSAHHFFLDGKVPIFCVHYSLGKSCMTSFWIGWIFHSFPVYRRFHCLFETGVPKVLKIVVIPHNCVTL